MVKPRFLGPNVLGPFLQCHVAAVGRITRRPVDEGLDLLPVDEEAMQLRQTFPDLRGVEGGRRNRFRFVAPDPTPTPPPVP